MVIPRRFPRKPLTASGDRYASPVTTSRPSRTSDYPALPPPSLPASLQSIPPQSTASPSSHTIATTAPLPSFDSPSFAPHSPSLVALRPVKPILIPLLRLAYTTCLPIVLIALRRFPCHFTASLPHSPCYCPHRHTAESVRCVRPLAPRQYRMEHLSRVPLCCTILIPASRLATRYHPRLVPPCHASRFLSPYLIPCPLRPDSCSSASCCILSLALL